MSGKQTALLVIVCIFGLIGFQYLLGFPWGLIATAVLAIVLLIKRKSRTQSRSSRQSPYTSPHSDDTQFYVCPRCGKDTGIHHGKQYCLNCKMYL